MLGHDAQAESLEVRRRTGVLPDAFHVYDRLTGRQHVEFATEVKDVDEDPSAVLERLGIADAADRKAGGYSKGMRQRLVMAIALVGDPDLLVLDEPSTGLDPNRAKEMRDIIRAKNERGTAVFFSSHIMEQVEAVCNRVAIINKGSLVTVDTIQGLRDATETGETVYIQVESLAEDTVERVRAVDGVTGATLDDGRIRVTLGDGRIRVTLGDVSKFRVLEIIDDTIVPIQDFSVVTSSLGDLFVHYTTEEQEVKT